MNSDPGDSYDLHQFGLPGDFMDVDKRPMNWG